MRISNEVLQELIDCYDDNSMEHSYYFNVKTNEIIFLSEYLDSGEEYEELNEEVEEGFGETYFRVPQTDSRQGFIDMEEFVETVKSDDVQAELYKALSGHRGVFRRFKDTLMDYPEIQQQYYQYKEERNKERVIEWLNEDFPGVVIE